MDRVATAGELSKKALTHLRDEEIEKAFEVLGTVADLELPANNRFEDPTGAAAAGLNRALAQLSTDEQYDLLHDWSMPTSDRKTVRVLTSLTPEIGPPMEFARALGERPKKETFQIASVGEMPGLFCSAWTMITAADDAGSLRRLITELEGHVNDEVPGAKFVLLLAQVRDSRADTDALKAAITGIADDESTLPGPHERSAAAIVAAAMGREELGEACEQIVNKLHEFKPDDGACGFVSFIRRLRAHVILQNRSPESDPQKLFYTTPALWVSADSQLRSETSNGADRSIWLTHEEHVKRLAGPGDDLLLFRYPLTGKFELKGEVANLDNGLGGLCYGALGFHATSKAFTVVEVQKQASINRVWPFVAPQEYRMFNRVNIRSDGEKVTFLSNLHPGWTGPSELCSTCPWLGLRGVGHGRPVFRNLELVGEPSIPREIRLDGADLRGWTSNNSTMSSFVKPWPHQPQPAEEGVAQLIPDWEYDGEAITGKHFENDEVQQTHLAYMRPLFDGEEINYEFMYEAGQTAISPCIGRMTFLMESRGIRVHWLTDGENEWSGLAPDNAVVEPLNRRGPRTLPLKEGEWNTVSLRLEGGQATIKLNGEDVYIRTLEGVSGRHFGFYYDRSSSSAKARNVILTGDWPEKLSDEQMGNLVAF